MLKITNGNVEKLVTKGAYENSYKAMGFEIIGDKKINKEVKEVKEAKVVEPIVEESEPAFDKKELEDFILSELKESKPKAKKGLK